MEDGKRFREDENKFESIIKNILVEIIYSVQKIKLKIEYMRGESRTANSMVKALGKLIKENEYQRNQLNEIINLCESNLYENPEIRLRKIKELAQSFPNV